MLKRFCKEIDIMQGNCDTSALILQAQNYIHSDPESCLVKIRYIIEAFVNGIYKKYNVDNVSDVSGLFNKIQNIEFYKTLTFFLSNHSANNIARRIVNILHRIRDLDNRGSHSKKTNKKCVTSNDSKFALH